MGIFFTSAKGPVILCKNLTFVLQYTTPDNFIPNLNKPSLKSQNNQEVFKIFEEKTLFESIRIKSEKINVDLNKYKNDILAECSEAYFKF